MGVLGVHRAALRFGALAALLALVVAVSGCAGSPTGGTTSTPSTPQATATPTASATGYAVSVYFARHTASDEDPTRVFAVARTSPTLGVATYAISQLLVGPTASEKSAGYYSPWEGVLTGASNCGGPDFTIALDHRGTTPAPGVVTLRFCRTTPIPGELAGARMETTARATLLQFPNIESVVILNASGACFDDLSGRNACLAG